MKASEAKARLGAGGSSVAIVDVSPDIKRSKGEQCAIFIIDQKTSLGDYITSQRGVDVKLRTIQAAYSFIRRDLDWAGPVSVQDPVSVNGVQK